MRTIQHIDILPCAGLGNRMRAIASAMSAAQELCEKPSICIHWKREAAVGAAFRDLFDITALPAWVQVAELAVGAPEPFKTEVNSETQWATFLEREKAGGTTVLQFKSHSAFFDANAQTWPSMCSDKASYRGVPNPSERWLRNLRSLRFVEGLVALADRNLSGLYGPLVGVHLRRQDHIHCVRECPAATMWAAMDAEPTLWFFFTSDSMEERKKASHKFPTRVRLSAEPYKGRDSVGGMMVAAIDFITLSKCSKVLGSFQSSFSEMAAAYGGIPFVAVRKSSLN